MKEKSTQVSLPEVTLHLYGRQIHGLGTWGCARKELTVSKGF